MSASGGRSANPPPPPPASPYKVICLGDSITLGSGISGVTTTYPDALGTLLGANYSVTNAGHGGAQVHDVDGFYLSQNAGQGWKYAVVMAGVNNIMKDPDDNSDTTTLGQFTTLLNDLVADGVIPIVLLPTPANGGSGSFASTAQKNAYWLSYHSGLISLCSGRGIACVDTWATMGDSTSPPTMLASMGSTDNIHPGQAGMNELARLARTALP